VTGERLGITGDGLAVTGADNGGLAAKRNADANDQITRYSDLASDR
jgi:hypothetical protein